MRIEADNSPTNRLLFRATNIIAEYCFCSNGIAGLSFFFVQSIVNTRNAKFYLVVSVLKTFV